MDKSTQSAPSPDDYRRFGLLIGAGGLGTNLGYAMYDLPLRFLRIRTTQRAGHRRVLHRWLGRRTARQELSSPVPIDQ